MWSSSSEVRYSALSQGDDLEGENFYGSKIAPNDATDEEKAEYWTAIESSNLYTSDDPARVPYFSDPSPEYLAERYASAFTYAAHNDLDRMGYEAPRRHGRAALNAAARGWSYGLSNICPAGDENRREMELLDEEQHRTGVVELLIVAFAYLLLVVTLPLSLLFSLKMVSSTERLVVLRLGRAQRPRGPGAALILPCVDTAHLVDTRPTAFHVPPLQVITQDRGLVELGATIYLRVYDVVAAVCAVQDRVGSTRTLARTMLYRYVCRKSVCDLTNEPKRRELADLIKCELAAATAEWGLEIKDIQLPDVKVLKSGENMALAALQTVAKSDVGQQLWHAIEPHVQQYANEIKERAEATKDDDNGSQEILDWSKPCSTSDTKPKEKPADQVPAKRVDVDRLLAHINLVLDEQLVSLVGKSLQVECEGTGPIFIDLRRGQGAAARGRLPTGCADVTFRLDETLLESVLSGKTNPTQAYLSGRLSISGPLQDALAFRHLADRLSCIL